jgi:hypothetical protein
MAQMLFLWRPYPRGLFLLRIPTHIYDPNLYTLKNLSFSSHISLNLNWFKPISEHCLTFWLCSIRAIRIMTFRRQKAPRFGKSITRIVLSVWMQNWSLLFIAMAIFANIFGGILMKQSKLANAVYSGTNNVELYQ